MYYNSEEDYAAYMQEQAYLQAQGQAEYEAWIAEQEDWYYSIQDRYHYATVKWFPTGDPTPVYLVVLAAFLAFFFLFGFLFFFQLQYKSI